MIKGKVIKVEKRWGFELSMWRGKKQLMKPYRSVFSFGSKSEASLAMMAAISLAEDAQRAFTEVYGSAQH